MAALAGRRDVGRRSSRAAVLGTTLLLLALVAHADAAKVYVSNGELGSRTGTDEAGCGTAESTPCRTLAYALANRAVADDIVQMSAGTYSLAGPIEKNVGLWGATSTTLGCGSERALEVRDGADVDLRSITITGCGSDDVPYGAGALVLGDSSLTMTSVKVMSCTAKKGGGVAVLQSGSLTAVNCQFEKNAAIQMGGAIYANGTSSIKLVAGTSVIDNLANDNDVGVGGGVALEDWAVADINTCTFEKNDAAQFGGDMEIRDSSVLRVVGTTFTSSFVSEGKGLVLHSTGFASISLVQSSFLDSSCAFGDCVASILLALPTVQPVIPQMNITDCVFDQPTRPMMQPLRAVIVEAADLGGQPPVLAGNPPLIRLNVSSTEFLVGRQTFFHFNTINLEGNIASTKFVGARGVAFFGGSQMELVMTDINATSTSVDYGGGFMQVTCATGSCSASVSDSVFHNCGTSRSNTYGGVFALSGSSTDVVVANITVTVDSSFGNAATRGGVFAVLNGAHATVLDSDLQSRAEYGGVFYLAPAVPVWVTGIEEEDKATVVARGCTFSNSAGTLGGAVVDANTGRTIERPHSIFTATDCVFDRCAAEGEGGVVTTWFGLLMTAIRCKFTNNKATGESGGGGVISVAEESDLHFVDCYFADNTATHTGGVILAKNNANVTMEGGLIEKCHARSGGVLYLSNSARMTVKGTRFQNNYGDIGGVATLIQTGNLVFDQCQFVSNTAKTFGGVLNAVGSSAADVTDLSVINSLFQNNKVTDGDGGTVVLGLSASSELRNCLIEGSSAQQTGGSIYLDASSLLILRNVTLQGGSALSGGGMFATGGGTIEGHSVRFLANHAKIGGSVALAGVATATLDDATVQQSSASSLGGAMYTAGRSVLYVNRAQIVDSVCETANDDLGAGGVFYSSSFATIAVKNTTILRSSAKVNGGILSSIGKATSTFENCYLHTSSASLAGMFALDTSAVLTMTNTGLYNSSSAQHGGLLSMGFTSSANFNNCTFDASWSSGPGGLAAQGDNSVLLISNSRIFGAASGVAGGVLALNGLASATLKSTVVRDGQSPAGGMMVVDDMSQVVLDSVSVSGFKDAGVGGVLYAASNGSVVTIRDSTIDDNSAQYGGFANIVSCKNLNLATSTFSNNAAGEAGGAFYFRTLDDVQSCACPDCTLSGNTALGYGPDKATTIASVVPTPATLDSVVSGDITHVPIVITGRDIFDQDIRYINTRLVVRVSAFNTNLTIGGETVITKTPSSTFQFGSITFAQVKFTAAPGSTQPLEVSVIYPAYVKNALVTLNFGICKQGQALEAGSAVCSTCKDGFYTFEASTLECKPCPLNANCPGGDRLKPVTGWWRRNNVSDTILECLFPPACLGYPAWFPDTGARLEFEQQKNDYNESCAEGYRGNLCFGCAFGYGRSGQAGCGECPHPVVNRFLIAFGLIGFIIIMSFLIYRTRKSAHDKKDKFMMMLKIFMSYLQFAGLAAGLKIDWPAELMNFFSIQSGVTSASDRIVSLDCWLHQESSPPGEVFFEMQFAYTMLPIMGISLIAMYWGGTFAWKYFHLQRHVDDVVNEMKQYHIESSIVSVLVFAFFLHPTITQQTFEMFTCRELFDGESYLVADLDVRCFTPEHYQWMFGVGLFRLIAYVLAIPLGALYLLWRQRDRLEEQDVRNRYGFLYAGFSVRCYYWEIIIMMRKVIVISIVVFFKQFGTLVQVMLAIGLVYLSFVLHLYARPYHAISKSEMDRMNDEAEAEADDDEDDEDGDTLAPLSSSRSRAGTDGSADGGDDTPLRKSTASTGSERLSLKDVSLDGIDAEGIAELDHLESVSLLATLGTFYFGYFLNADTISADTKIALIVVILLINSVFMLEFARAIKKELNRKAKEIIELKRAKRAKEKNKNRRKLPSNAHGRRTTGFVEMRRVTRAALPSMPEFSGDVRKKGKGKK